MYAIGLTGGIASGKTTAAEILRSLGADVIDADAIARRMTSPGGAAAAQVLSLFGTLDRETIANRVFADASSRKALETVVHPLVTQEIIRRMRDSTARIGVLDIPLLFESGMQNTADEIWVVYVSFEMQMRRVISRGLTPEQASARIGSQLSTEEKIRRADVAIDASGTPDELRKRIRPHFARALRKAEANA
ncbi:MAG: dephospho-CoA kinase [Clostridia bacterium]|nr:dephospho-CoA kinase [Clostridia bacterium]